MWKGWCLEHDEIHALRENVVHTHNIVLFTRPVSLSLLNPAQLLVNAVSLLDENELYSCSVFEEREQIFVTKLIAELLIVGKLLVERALVEHLH